MRFNKLIVPALVALVHLPQTEVVADANVAQVNEDASSLLKEDLNLEMQDELDDKNMEDDEADESNEAQEMEDGDEEDDEEMLMESNRMSPNDEKAELEEALGLHGKGCHKYRHKQRHWANKA